MKQFPTILAFELKSYFKNKSYLITTILLVAVIAVVMFFPRIRALFGGGAADDPFADQAGILYTEQDGQELSALFPDADDIMLLAAAEEEALDLAGESFAAAFPSFHVIRTARGEAYLREQIEAGNASCGFFLRSLNDYVYYVDNLTLYDSNARIADEVMRSLYQLSVMRQNGVPDQTAEEILSAVITHEEVSLDKDQSVNFFYTYIMIFVLYMVIMLYGQMIATGVATEKSSRAMELLITSAKPLSMMFGKVIASCIAGLVQIILVFGGALLLYRLNASYWGGNAIVAMFFDIPPSLLLYMILFFLLGFLFYAMMFGAIGSTVSKVEDVSTAITPVMLLYLPGFFVAIYAITGGGVDTMLTKVFSFLPFSSPFVMFTRIAMSTVPPLQIFVSVAILIASVIFIGVLAAKIYRVGVLLYGTKPKLLQLIKTVAKA